MVYTYFSDRKKLITVTTRDMANVERFDQMVVAHLDCETWRDWKKGSLR